MKNELSERNQGKVINILTKMQGIDRCIWRPRDFENNFPFISAEALIVMLNILSDKGYITVLYADYPDSFNIAKITVHPKAYDYAPQKALKTKEKWFERAYGFIAGVLVSVAASCIINQLIPALTAAISTQAPAP